jgi:hypothetical protein
MAYGQGLYSTWFYGVDGNYIDASASISASSNIPDVAANVTLVGDASTTVASTTTVAFERVAERSVPINVLAEMVPIGAINAAGAAVVTPSLTVTGGAIRVAQSSAQVSPALTVADITERVREASSAVSAAASISASANFTAAGASAIDAVVTIVATCNRVQSTGSNVSVSALFAASAREKWELIVDPTDTWTPLADDSVTWTELPTRAA